MTIAHLLAAMGATRNSELLTWAPPALTTPNTLHLDNTFISSSDFQIDLDAGEDYIIVCDEILTKQVRLNGGRHIRAIGGHVQIPSQGTWPDDGNTWKINERRGLHLENQTGTVHIEGWLFNGADISEGINIAAPLATVQIQNCRVENLHARDQVTYEDNHPDVLQSWGSCAELRVDKLTGYTDYQGITIGAAFNAPHGVCRLKRINIVEDPDTGTHQLFWMYPNFDWDGNTVYLDNVWLDNGASGAFGVSIWPATNHSTVAYRPTLSTDGDGNTIAEWLTLDNPFVSGHVTQGTPPDGDYVLAETVGIGYVSPGYAA